MISNMTASLNQIAHSRLRFPAWLGIFAILMLFVAPIVSKTLVAQGVPMPMMAGMDMSEMGSPSINTSSINMPSTDDMSSMNMSALAESDHVRHDKSTTADSSSPATMSASDMMDAACGYCVLLMHLPLLAMLILPMLWSRAIVVRPSPPRAIACPASALIFKDSQPRAPPVLASVVLPFKV